MRGYMAPTASSRAASRRPPQARPPLRYVSTHDVNYARSLSGGATPFCSEKRPSALDPSTSATPRAKSTATFHSAVPWRTRMAGIAASPSLRPESACSYPTITSDFGAASATSRSLASTRAPSVRSPGIYRASTCCSSTRRTSTPREGTTDCAFLQATVPGHGGLAGMYLAASPTPRPKSACSHSTVPPTPRPKSACSYSTVTSDFGATSATSRSLASTRSPFLKSRVLRRSSAHRTHNIHSAPMSAPGWFFDRIKESKGPFSRSRLANDFASNYWL